MLRTPVDDMHAGEAPGRMYGGSSSSNNERVHAQSCTQERELKGRAKGLTAITSLCSFATTTLLKNKPRRAVTYASVWLCTGNGDGGNRRQEAQQEQTHIRHTKTKQNKFCFHTTFRNHTTTRRGREAGAFKINSKKCRALLCLVTFTFP